MGVKRLTREQIINRIIGFDFVEWYERLLLIKAVISLPKPKAGVYHQGQQWLVNQPEVASIFETGTVGFAPSEKEEELTFKRKYRHTFENSSVSTKSDSSIGDTNEWNKMAWERKFGKR